jgi:hypothetical protein
MMLTWCSSGRERTSSRVARRLSASAAGRAHRPATSRYIEWHTARTRPVGVLRCVSWLRQVVTRSRRSKALRSADGTLRCAPGSRGPRDLRLIPRALCCSRAAVCSSRTSQCCIRPSQRCIRVALCSTSASVGSSRASLRSTSASLCSVRTAEWCLRASQPSQGFCQRLSAVPQGQGPPAQDFNPGHGRPRTLSQRFYPPISSNASNTASGRARTR